MISIIRAAVKENKYIEEGRLKPKLEGKVQQGWDREGGREGDARGKRYGDICICITDSLCYKAETNTPW